MPMQLLPSQVYDGAKQAHMQGKAGRVVVSWNQFARNLKEAFQIYKEAKQVEIQSFLEDYVQRLREALPLKPLLLAIFPYLVYLIFYSKYRLIRSVTGLDEIRKPNFTFLPWLEYFIFRCYPHRILARFAVPLLDFIAAIPYLIHFPLPAFFLLYLLAGESRRRHVFAFMWCAGWVNCVALVVQYFFPTAPPWFVDSAVFDSNGEFLMSGSNEAGFHRLDSLVGLHFFHGIYAASPLKFGAFPSLHVAWPAIILVNQPWIGKKFAWIHVLWISWAAMYSNHHYAVDALGGILLVFIVNFSMIKIWSPFHSSNIKAYIADILRLQPSYDQFAVREV